MIRIIPRKTPDLPPVRLKAEGLDFFGDLERAEIRNHVASLRWTSRGGAATRWEYHFPGNSAGAMCDFGFTPPDSLGSTRNGVNFHPLSAPGTLGQPPLLTSVGFPLPPAGTIFPLAAVLSTSVGQQLTTVLDGTINDDPTVTRLQIEKLTGPCCSAYQS